MTTLMQKGHGAGGFLDRKLAAAAAVTLTLSRVNSDGAFAGTVTDAVEGANDKVSERQGGRVRFDYSRRTYLIPAASYAFTGLGAVEPRQGDRIGETVNGVRMTFEVAPSTGVPAWEYAGQGLTRYRVNAKRVTDEAGR